MNTALLAIGCLMILATVIPVFQNEAWWIRVFDFPRAQIIVVAAVVLVAYWLTAGPFDAMEWAFLAALILSLCHQAYMMYPYLPLARKQVQRSRNARPESSLSLLTANVLMTNRRAEDLLRIVRAADPDVILVVETDRWWKEQLRALEKTHPFIVHQPQENTYGMLLYSRLELLGPMVKFLVQDDIPSIHTRVRLPSAQEVELRCLHPRPPFPTEDDSSIGRDAELLMVGKELKKATLPVVVMGDLNDVAWSRTNYLFQDISGLLDPRIGRGFFNTFHARLPFLRFPLDHFFHSNDFRLIEFKRLAYFGSDHFPVFIALSHEADAQSEQPEQQATVSDKQAAEEKIAKVA